MCFPSSGHSRAGASGSSDSFLWLLFSTEGWSPSLPREHRSLLSIWGIYLFLTCFACKLHLAKSISSNGTLGQIADCYWSPFPVKYHHWDHGVEVAFVFWGLYFVFCFPGHPMAGGQGHASLQPLLTTNSSETCKRFSHWICLWYCSYLWGGQLLENRCISYLASTVARKLFVKSFRNWDGLVWNRMCFE